MIVVVIPTAPGRPSTTIDLSPWDVSRLGRALRIIRASDASYGRSMDEPLVALLMACQSQAPREGQMGPPWVTPQSAVKHDGMSHADALLSIPQAAARLGVSTSTAKRRVAERLLPSLMVGGLRRVRPGDLDAFIAAGLDHEEAGDGE